MKTPYLLHTLAFLLFSLPACAAPPAPASGHAIDSPRRVLTDYENVQTASQFSVGGVGYAGTIAPEETSLRNLLKKKSTAEADCRRLVADATSAGKLYGLLGLKLLNSASYSAAAEPFRESRTTVTTTAGCMQYPQAMSAVVKEIDKGDYR